MTTDKTWRAVGTGNHQGLIVDDETGRNVAVAYDKADAPLLAAAPALLSALRRAYELLDTSDIRHYVSTELGEQAALHKALNDSRAAIQSATEVK